MHRLQKAETGNRKSEWHCAFWFLVFFLPVFGFCFSPFSVLAQSEAARTQLLPPPPGQTFNATPYATDIARIEDYLNDLKTLKSRFIQADPGQGVISNGTVYLSRPGNARWDYISPSNVSIIVNNDSVTYYDRDLDQISYGSMDSPLTSILTKQNIALGKAVLIRHIGKLAESDELELTLSDPGITDATITTLTLVFQINPFTLKRIRRTTESNETITVTLLDPRINIELDDSLFTFKNPRIHERKRRN